MPYDAPGFADSVNAAILAAWNDEIQQIFRSLSGSPHLGRARSYLLSTPDLIQGPAVDAVKWTGEPAEPRFCLDETWAEKLSDWGATGRHRFHNEYCEYTLVLRPDGNGRMRPKRFTATTELPEWWLAVATHDPARVRQMAAEVLRTPPSYPELYGADVTDPQSLSAAERRVRFATQVSGHGKHQDLQEAGVPENPVGDLNRRNALFMSHPINGLDDLIYIVMFGAQPYVVRSGSGYRRAELHEIFKAEGVTHLACRNADPAAAQAAYDQVLKSIADDGRGARGCQIAFANPPGMYIRGFNVAGLTYDGRPVPPSWIRLRRGRPGYEQRVEIGPTDNEAGFLDDIMVEEGAATARLSGGYQLAKRIEVGPKLVLGPDRDFRPALAEIAEDSERLDCSAADICNAIERSRREYEQEHSRRGPRGPG